MFDEEALLAQVDGDIGFLAETVQMLASDGRDLLGRIREALAAGDAAAVGRHAHALKGMVSNFCAPQTHASTLDLERQGKAGDLAAAADRLATVSQQLEALLTELNAWLQERS